MPIIKMFEIIPDGIDGAINVRTNNINNAIIQVTPPPSNKTTYLF